MKFFAPVKLSDNIRKTPEGFLLCIGVPIARTGEMIYTRGETPVEPGPDGLVTITREPEEVFDPAAMASFEGKSFTIRHPEEFVDPKNWKELTTGHLQNVRRGKETNDDGDELLLSDILVTDAIAIGLVEKGMRDVSCGYDAEYIETAKGKGKQIKIRGNHCALVEDGRAGESCAITDHDGRKLAMSKEKAKQKFWERFTKTMDAAMDEDTTEGKKKESEDEDGEETPSFDELTTMMKDMMGKIDAMSKVGDEEEPKKKEAPKKKDDSESEDEEEETGSVESRLKAIEAAIAKLMEGESEDEDGDDDMDAEDEDYGEESEDEDMEKKDKTSDSLSRAEILAPGIKKSKDIQAKALKIAYGTKDGKKIIDSLTGKKSLTLDSAAQTKMLFSAASELMKEKRKDQLKSTKSSKVRDSDYELGDNTSDVVNADKLNEMNAKHYGLK